MCKCTPSIRTMYCGRIGCMPPIPEGTRLIPELQSAVEPVELISQDIEIDVWNKTLYFRHTSGVEYEINHLDFTPNSYVEVVCDDGNGMFKSFEYPAEGIIFLR